jgi:hypothetical protein
MNNQRIKNMNKKLSTALLLGLASASLFTACGSVPTATTSPSLLHSSGAMTSGDGYATTPIPMPSAVASSAPIAEATSAPTSSDATPEPTATGTPSSTDTVTEASPDLSQSRAGLLTAGTWSDLEHWDFWLNLLGKSEWRQELEHWQLLANQRIPVQMQHGDMPLVDQPLQLKDSQGNLIAEARTNQAGQANFFVNLSGQEQSKNYQVLAPNTGLSLESVQSKQGQFRAYTLKSETAAAVSNNVDIMLTIDTTGSMGDELEYLKIELKSVLERIKSNQSQLDLRVSTNFYRDAGDDYLVRPFAFSRDFNQVQNQLQAQRADGGGDAPEAVNEALEDAINQHEWSSSARARLLFLVLDAPPHHSANNLKRLKEVLLNASRRGIRIIPIASSGVDKETEFLMRLFAITTGGEYIFLTSDSGIGTAQGHIEPTIGAYKVEKLNNLLVRTVEKYTQILPLKP